MYNAVVKARASSVMIETVRVHRGNFENWIISIYSKCTEWAQLLLELSRNP